MTKSWLRAWVVVLLGAMTRRWAPQTCYTLRCNTASILRGLVLVWKYKFCCIRINVSKYDVKRFATKGFLTSNFSIFFWLRPSLIQNILLILFRQRTLIINHCRIVLRKVYGVEPTFFWQTEMYLYTINCVQIQILHN